MHTYVNIMSKHLYGFINHLKILFHAASKCPDLSTFVYGNISIPSYKPGSRAHYICYRGYKLVGDPYRTCQDDCEWSGKPPRCVRKLSSNSNFVSLPIVFSDS